MPPDYEKRNCSKDESGSDGQESPAEGNRVSSRGQSAVGDPGCEYDESERDEDYRNQARSMHGVIVSRSADRSASEQDLRPTVSSLAAGLWMRCLLTLRLWEDSLVPEWQYARLRAKKA